MKSSTSPSIIGITTNSTTAMTMSVSSIIIFLLHYSISIFSCSLYLRKATAVNAILHKNRRVCHIYTRLSYLSLNNLCHQIKQVFYFLAQQVNDHKLISFADEHAYYVMILVVIHCATL